MAAVGNLNDYVKFQMGKGMEARRQAAPAGMATEMAVGFGIAQQMMQQQGGAGGAGAADGGRRRRRAAAGCPSC